MNSCKGHIEKLLFLIVFVTISGCTETFDIENEDLESFMVVNATITDQVKNQKIVLSRTFGFEEEDPVFEEGAIVKVIENDAIEYTFDEIFPGEYQSIQEFGVTADKEYQLSIQTQNGRSYVSEKVIAPKGAFIEEVYAKRMFNDQGVEGIGVFLNSFDAEGNSRYYRFVFEETYRITAPGWIQVDLTYDGSWFALVPRPEDQKVCYKTQSSIKINLVNTDGLTEDRIQDLFINFIPADDISLVDRYSILVKQFVQTNKANSFYKVLEDFSGSENLFSQIQPGFIAGNIVSKNNDDENVLGFFDVSTVSEQRIFFDRDEFLSDLPAFEIDCEEVILPEEADPTLEGYVAIVQSTLVSNKVRLKVPPFIPPPGIIPDFSFVPRACGDCTALGKSAVPDFWID